MILGKNHIERLPPHCVETARCRVPGVHHQGKGDDLNALAREARRQIDGKKYDATFRAEGIADIVKIGLAYYIVPLQRTYICSEEIYVKFTCIQVGRCETSRSHNFGRKRFVILQMIFMLEIESHSLAANGCF